MLLKIRPPRSSVTVVKIVGMPYAFAVFARPVTLFMTIVGSWLLTFASWNGWWSISTRTQLSGVSSASNPTLGDASMMWPFPKEHCWAGAESQPIRSTELREALAQLGDKQIGLLERGEVPALGDHVPVDQLRVGPLAPDLRRLERLAGEHTHGDGHVELLPREVRRKALEIEPRRRRPRVREPIEHDVVEHLVVGQPRRVLGIRPLRQLLIDPGGLADRRVGEAVAERLRPRALDPGVARAAVAVRRQPRQGGLLLGARLALEGRREEDRKVQVNGLQALHVLLGHPGGHARTPIAA